MKAAARKTLSKCYLLSADSVLYKGSGTCLAAEYLHQNKLSRVESVWEGNEMECAHMELECKLDCTCATCAWVCEWKIICAPNINKIKLYLKRAPLTIIQPDCDHIEFPPVKLKSHNMSTLLFLIIERFMLSFFGSRGFRGNYCSISICEPPQAWQSGHFWSIRMFCKCFIYFCLKVGKHL